MAPPQSYTIDDIFKALQPGSCRSTLSKFEVIPGEQDVPNYRVTLHSFLGQGKMIFGFTVVVSFATNDSNRLLELKATVRGPHGPEDYEWQVPEGGPTDYQQRIVQMVLGLYVRRDTYSRRIWPVEREMRRNRILETARAHYPST